MKIAIVLLVLAVTLFSLLGGIAAVALGEHTTMNGLPRDIYLIRVHKGTDLAYRGTVNRGAIERLYALNGPNIWDSYSNGGFTVQWNKGYYESYFDLWADSRLGQPYYVFVFVSPDRPNKRYLFVLSSLATNCNGGHCGSHDWVRDGPLATVFEVNKADIIPIYRIAGLQWLGG